MEIICKLFKDACLYFSSAKDFAEDWLIGDKPEDMMHKFGLATSEVIISEEYGFFSEGKDITKAGNQATRADYYTDIVVGLRDTNPTFISPEFAPGIGFEDYTSLEISNKTKQKVKEIELKLRAACIAALELEGPKKITKYLNSEYQRTIDRGLEQEKLGGRCKYIH